MGATDAVRAATRRTRRCGDEQNIGWVQRSASLVGGTALVVAGARRRSLGGVALAAGGADLLYRGATGYCHGLAALGIDTKTREPVEVQRSITVEAPRGDVYARWRDPATQPPVWSHFADVTNATERGAHWRVELPLGRTLEWDSEITEDREPELIAWRSTGGDMPNEGSVEFRDAPREYGTEITLRVRFEPPAGPLGSAAARVFDEPPKLVLAKALRRFKSLVESGEIASTERNPSGRES